MCYDIKKDICLILTYIGGKLMEKTFWNRVNNKELLEQVGDGKEVIWINENQ